MAATERIMGNGAIIKVDAAGNNNFITVGAVQNFTLPPEDFAEGDATCFEDAIEQMLPGIELAGEFTFNTLFDPVSDSGAALRTLRASKATRSWQVVLPYATPRTAAFTGYIKSFTPSSIDPKSTVATQCTVRRKSTIVWT